MIGDMEILAQRAAEAYRAGRNPTPEEYNALIQVTRLRLNRQSMSQVWALIGAGWTWEMVHEDADPWQWAWRRPSRRKGRPGRRFASTGQAYNALIRERGGPN